MATHGDRRAAPKWGIVLATWLMLVVASCGGGGLTLTEYAEEAEGLTTAMYGTIDELIFTFETASEADRDVHAFQAGLAVAFGRMRDGFQALEPPDEAAELHIVSLDIMTRLTAAQEAFAERVADYEMGDEWDLDETPEAVAVQAVQQEMVAFCQARQAEFDATADREALADNTWIPNEMKEVVTVLFGCGAEEGDGS